MNRFGQVVSFEGLENRAMMAVDPTLGSAWLDKGTLYYQGTTGNDDIYITRQGGNLVVLNHYKLVGSFDPAAVKAMNIVLEAGNDAVYLGSIHSGPTLIDAGTGDDRLYCSIGNDTVLAGEGNDVITALGGNDSIRGGDGADSIYGNDGNDTLYGEDGRDVLGGGKGDDFLDGGFDADTLRGEEGVDTVSYADRVNSVFVDATGYGKGEAADDGEAGENDFVDGDNENLIGGKGDDVLVGSYDPNNNFKNTFIAHNRLTGGEGNDTLVGLDGNDVLDGGLGADVFEGGSGIDVADYSKRSDNLVVRITGKAESGVVGRRGRSGEGDVVNIDIENVSTGSGHDFIVGSDLANTLNGNGGNDTVMGMGGDDFVYGGVGADSLNGGDGNDNLYANDLPLPLPGNKTKRRRALAAAADKIDGAAGFDRVKYDIADGIANIERVLK